MLFENKNLIRSLRKKYSKEKLIIFTDTKPKSIKTWRKVLNNVLRVMSKELNYDLYIFDTTHDKALNKYGTVFHYDKTCLKSAIYKIEDLIAIGCRRAFILNTDIIDKRLLDERLVYRFLFLSTIQDIYFPNIKSNDAIKIGGADMFNFVRDVEALLTEKICYCDKQCLKEFKENEYKFPERLVYFKFDKKDLHNHIKIIDCLLE